MTPEQGFELKEKVAALSAALLEKNPQMPILLRTIHKQLREDEELVTTLSEEDIGIIVQGLMAHTQTVVTAAPVKKESAASIIKKALKSGSGGSVADLF